MKIIEIIPNLNYCLKLNKEGRYCFPPSEIRHVDSIGFSSADFSQESKKKHSGKNRFAL